MNIRKSRGWNFPGAWGLALVLAAAASCSQKSGGENHNNPGVDERFARERAAMVERQIAARGVSDERVLEAMREVPRHKFVLPNMTARAYDDRPLPIGHGQTISQPYIVALMTELLQPDDDDVVLEIGTGSAYQAAILGELAGEVYTIEIVEPLGEQARERLEAMGYENVHVKIGDGYRGWPEHAPFDGIIVTAAPDHVPQPLIEQLKVGGRMVIPVGEYGRQELYLMTKNEEGELEEQMVLPVRFVPMTGESQER